ncbi:MAG: hypothetical protein QNJ45_01845 [Ardenticatenaceae bacterium]|nr:hypothetical protein [Ardenticatenaceae bacterium]
MKASIILILLLMMGGSWAAVADTQIMMPRAYLPVVQSASICPTTSNRSYASLFVTQFDKDNPVRPAVNHADKNLGLRGYIANTNPGLIKDLVDYGVNDPTAPPQLATLFSPNRVPPISGLLRIHEWQWAPSPNPGQRGGPIVTPVVSAISFDLPAGIPLRAPASGYDIGGGMEVVIMYADEDTVALHYTREDSAARGYTVHVDGICTDPNLISLYNSLDRPDGPRYNYPSPGYALPALPAGQPFGVTSGKAVVVATADGGAFQDPRSCNDWWQIRPGYGGGCTSP